MHWFREEGTPASVIATLGTPCRVESGVVCRATNIVSLFAVSRVERDCCAKAIRSIYQSPINDDNSVFHPSSTPAKSIKPRSLISKIDTDGMAIRHPVPRGPGHAFIGSGDAAPINCLKTQAASPRQAASSQLGVRTMILSCFSPARSGWRYA